MAAVESVDVRARAREQLKTTLDEQGVGAAEQVRLLGLFDARAKDVSDPDKLQSIATALINGGDVNRAQVLQPPRVFGARLGGPSDRVANDRVIFDPAKADFGTSGRAIPSQDLETAARFSVPIPASAAGQPLVNGLRYPTDMLEKDGRPDPRAGQPYPNGGQPMTDYKGEPIRGPNNTDPRGQVFFNYVDAKWQGVQSTGDAVLLFNRATPAQRQQLQQWIDNRGGPSSLNPQGISELTRYARSIGVGDVYDSNMAYVGAKLTPVEGQSTSTAGYGTFTRVNETVQAGVVTGPGFIPGLNVTLAPGQQAVLIRTNGGEVRHVEASAFRATYRKPDGTSIELSDLPTLSFKP